MTHDELCEKMEKDFPPIHDFLEMWGKHCGAPRTVFRGHLIALLRGIDAMNVRPEGVDMVSVPREPTMLMLRAGSNAMTVPIAPDDQRDMWTAMLAAAGAKE